MAAHVQVKTIVTNLAPQGLRELSDPAKQLGVSVRSSCCNQRPKHLNRRQVYSDSYTQLTVSEGSAHHWLERRTCWDRGTKSKSKKKSKKWSRQEMPLIYTPTMTTSSCQAPFLSAHPLPIEHSNFKSISDLNH